MERMGSRRAAQQNGDGSGAERAGGARAAAVTVTVAVVAALAGCSVTVNPKNAAATRPLSTSQSPTATASAASSSVPSTSAPSTSASPTPAPSDVDHTVCSDVRDTLATLRQKLVTDKDSTSRTAQDYHTAGSNLRLEGTKTKNTDLRTTLRTVGTDYQTVGYDVSSHDSIDADLTKVADASKPLTTLCGGAN